MSHRLPPLSALRAFEAAARLGRMTAAAEELSVTPGAISRQVRQLEQHLGVALFDGSKARPTLTPAAHVLQPVLTTAFAHIADAVREVSDSRRGPLDVACFSTFTVKWLIPLLFDFQAQHPGIEVRLRTTDAGTGGRYRAAAHAFTGGARVRALLLHAGGRRARAGHCRRPLASGDGRRVGGAAGGPAGFCGLRL